MMKAESEALENRKKGPKESPLMRFFCLFLPLTASMLSRRSYLWEQNLSLHDRAVFLLSETEFWAPSLCTIKAKAMPAITRKSELVMCRIRHCTAKPQRKLLLSSRRNRFCESQFPSCAVCISLSPQFPACGVWRESQQKLWARKTFANLPRESTLCI